MTIAIGSLLLDVIRMGLLLPLSGVLFLLGTRLFIFVGRLASGWGLVETVVNPLRATLYPDDKTARPNHLHARWLGVAMSQRAKKI